MKKNPPLFTEKNGKPVVRCSVRGNVWLFYRAARGKVEKTVSFDLPWKETVLSYDTLYLSKVLGTQPL